MATGALLPWMPSTLESEHLDGCIDFIDEVPHGISDVANDYPHTVSYLLASIGKSKTRGGVEVGDKKPSEVGIDRP